jgi:hypothetical protein
VGDEPMCGGLERRRGQAVPEVRLVEPNQPQAGRCHVVTQPTKRQLVRNGEHDECFRGSVPINDDIGVRDREIEGRVCGLTCLGPGGQIAPYNKKKAGSTILTVRHDSTVARPGQDRALRTAYNIMADRDRT